MKIIIEGSEVTLVSTNPSEFRTLIDMYTSKFFGTVTGSVVGKRTHKKHKRHIFSKACGLCEKKIKGNAAMAMHMKAHRVRDEVVTGLID